MEIHTLKPEIKNDLLVSLKLTLELDDIIQLPKYDIPAVVAQTVYGACNYYSSPYPKKEIEELIKRHLIFPLTRKYFIFHFTFGESLLLKVEGITIPTDDIPNLNLN